MPNAGNDIGIGTRVRGARRRLGWSREALAFHSGISWSAISQLEAGRRRNLRPSTLAALARALGVTIDYLVTGCPAAPPMLEHQALLYNDDGEFLTLAASFLQEGADRSEAVLAVTTDEHCQALRERVGAAARQIEFAEQAGWCASPSVALGRLRTFVDRHLDTGRPWVRVVVEPMAAEPSDPVARLWAQYESLLNLVFRSVPLTVVCAYDVTGLNAGLSGDLALTHPHTVGDGGIVTSPDYVDPIAFLLESDAVGGECGVACS